MPAPRPNARRKRPNGMAYTPHTASTIHALYDPARDGELPIRDLTAAICGDPPVGRSALDQARGEAIGGAR